jgi:hypothetical protein
VAVPVKAVPDAGVPEYVADEHVNAETVADEGVGVSVDSLQPTKSTRTMATVLARKWFTFIII